MLICNHQKLVVIDRHETDKCLCRYDYNILVKKEHYKLYCLECSNLYLVQVSTAAHTYTGLFNCVYLGQNAFANRKYYLEGYFLILLPITIIPKLV